MKLIVDCKVKEHKSVKWMYIAAVLTENMAIYYQALTAAVLKRGHLPG